MGRKSQLSSDSPGTSAGDESRGLSYGIQPQNTLSGKPQYSSFSSIAHSQGLLKRKSDTNDKMAPEKIRTDQQDTKRANILDPTGEIRNVHSKVSVGAFNFQESPQTENSILRILGSIPNQTENRKTYTKAALAPLETRIHKPRYFYKDWFFLASSVNFNVVSLSLSDLENEAGSSMFEVSLKDNKFKLATQSKIVEYNLDQDVDQIFLNKKALLLTLKHERNFREIVPAIEQQNYSRVLIYDIQINDVNDIVFHHIRGNTPEVEDATISEMVAKFNSKPGERAGADKPRMFLGKNLKSLALSRKGSKGVKIGTPTIVPTVPSDFYNASARTRSKEMLDHTSLLPLTRTKKEQELDIDEFPKLVEHTDPFKQLTYRFQDKSSITITVADYCCLYNNQWINDSLIDFFLKYWVEKSDNQTQYSDVHVLTTYFYTKILTAKPGTDGKTNYYEVIKRWLAKLELYKYRYIIMPINECLHWYCAIIYNFSEVISSIKGEPPNDRIFASQESDNSSDFKYEGESIDSQKVVVFYFDSLSQKHENIAEPIIASLIGYAKDVLDVELTKDMFVLKRATVPKQNNFNDCGIHVIYNVQQFLKKTDLCLKLWSRNYHLKKKSLICSQIFLKSERDNLRSRLRKELCHLESNEPVNVAVNKTVSQGESDDEIEIVHENKPSQNGAVKKNSENSSEKSSEKSIEKSPEKRPEKSPEKSSKEMLEKKLLKQKLLEQKLPEQKSSEKRDMEEYKLHNGIGTGKNKTSIEEKRNIEQQAQHQPRIEDQETVAGTSNTQTGKKMTQERIFNEVLNKKTTNQLDSNTGISQPNLSFVTPSVQEEIDTLRERVKDVAMNENEEKVKQVHGFSPERDISNRAMPNIVEKYKLEANDTEQIENVIQLEPESDDVKEVEESDEDFDHYVQRTNKELLKALNKELWPEKLSNKKILKRKTKRNKKRDNSGLIIPFLKAMKQEQQKKPKLKPYQEQNEPHGKNIYEYSIRSRSSSAESLREESAQQEGSPPLFKLAENEILEIIDVDQNSSDSAVESRTSRPRKTYRKKRKSVAFDDVSNRKLKLKEHPFEVELTKEIVEVSEDPEVTDGAIKRRKSQLHLSEI